MSSGPPPRPPPAMLNSFETGHGMQPQYPSYSSGFGGPNFNSSYMPYGSINPYSQPTMYGTPNMGYNSAEGAFIRQAEESSRGAFQSIESVVNAVASIATVLNSTHTAVFSSFRAVIGVVEQFRVLKQQFTVFIIAVIRRIDSEDIWSGLSSNCPPFAGKSTGVNWATLMFWIVALGGPYLIYKSVAQMVNSGLYDFVAANNQELSFSSNEMLRVAPKHEQPPNVRDWLLASSKDGKRIGLVPMNYIRLINRNITSSPPVQHSSILDSKSNKKDLEEVYKSAFRMPNKSN
uniref:Peroxisomal membrane protein PEX13 n=1 Tax=Ditylenchus dipsaci TaxID=166011 RepID=A0A915DED5_9BILA